MMISDRRIESLAQISDIEYKELRHFLNTHSLKTLEFKGKSIPYYFCGVGKRTILTFAGGWGPPLMLYDRILGLEGNNQIVVVEISAFDDLEEMCDGINQVLEAEKINQVVLFGQSMTGIMAQSYLKRNKEKVEGIVLANTIAPRAERCKKWALLLFQILPFSLVRFFAKRKMTQLGSFEGDISDEVKQRLLFKMELLKGIMDSYFRKTNTMNTLKIAYAFNEKDVYSEGEFEEWKGKALILTSEDDPYYPDADIFMKNFPNAEVFKLPTGFKHVAPQVYKDEFHREIQRFIDQLAV